MSSKFENPKMQFETLKNLFANPKHEISAKHYFIDKSTEIKEQVIDTAVEDKSTLGCPAICSGCKMIMEKALGAAAKTLKSNTLIMGYAKYQGIQNWVEQTPQQMAFLEKELKKKNVNIVSPFYNVLEYPFDVSLLLSSMGVPLKNHKVEMKCYAGDLNPDNLDFKRLNDFLKQKNETTGLSDKVSLLDDIPTAKIKTYQQSIAHIEKLKADKGFKKGAYNGK